MTHRFEFGANWRQFLSVLTDERIAQAQQSLRQMLDAESLEGRHFLDIGSGSGLFSLAARRLGARVHSFDFDRSSVACTEELKKRYFPDDPDWQIEQGSAIDPDYMRALGCFDVVYSWGVLHHTGAMWVGIENACRAVAPEGHLFIAIYNDQGLPSIWWTRVKRTYNKLPRPLRAIYLVMFAVGLETAAFGLALVRLEPRKLIDRWTRYQNVRGMSRWHDIVDWVGGFPFEVAAPKDVIEFCGRRGFTLAHVKNCGRKMGCNEFVFARRIEQE